jgi:hypothetical protein
MNEVLQFIFKRYTQERSPPELYNHGFENMESLGAIYSRYLYVYTYGIYHL